PQIDRAEAEIPIPAGDLVLAPADRPGGDVEADIASPDGIEKGGQRNRKAPNATANVQNPVAGLQPGMVHQVPQELPADRIEIPVADIMDAGGRPRQLDATTGGVDLLPGYGPGDAAHAGLFSGRCRWPSMAASAGSTFCGARASVSW